MSGPNMTVWYGIALGWYVGGMFPNYAPFIVLAIGIFCLALDNSVAGTKGGK